MSTEPPARDLSAALFGKTRRAVLALLHSRPDESFYLRQIVRATGAGLGAVQRELRQLAEAGIISRTGRGRQVDYQANRQCPIFAELHALVIKTGGVVDVLRQALQALADHITVAFIHGSIARGSARSRSDVDILVVGEASFAEVVSALGPAQERIGREVNPSVYPPEEFSRKLGQGHHFLTAVVREAKVFVLGGERELAGLAQGGLAHRASKQPARNRRLARHRGS